MKKGLIFVVVFILSFQLVSGLTIIFDRDFDKDNYYTKIEVQGILENYYNETEIDLMLSTLDVDLSGYYNKSEVDILLSNIDLSAYYNKTEIDNFNYVTGTPWTSEGYLTSESDPTVPDYVKNITSTEKINWNTAFGWGDHSLFGYITSLSNYYNKSEVDTLISNVEVDLSNYYNKSEVYNNTEIDTKLYNSVHKIEVTNAQSLSGTYIISDEYFIEMDDNGVMVNTSVFIHETEPTFFISMYPPDSYFWFINIGDDINDENTWNWYYIGQFGPPDWNYPDSTMNLNSNYGSGTANLYNYYDNELLFYLKSEVDYLINNLNLNFNNYYNNSEIDYMFSLLDFDPEKYYNTTDIDTLLDNVQVDLSDYYNKSEIDEMLFDTEELISINVTGITGIGEDLNGIYIKSDTYFLPMDKEGSMVDTPMYIHEDNDEYFISMWSPDSYFWFIFKGSDIEDDNTWAYWFIGAWGPPDWDVPDSTMNSNTDISGLGFQTAYLDVIDDIVLEDKYLSNITYFNSSLTIDVSLPTSNVFVDATCLTLPKGTYMISSHATMGRDATTAQTLISRIRDKTNDVTLASTSYYHASVSGSRGNLALNTINTFEGNSNICLQGATTAGNANAKIFSKSGNSNEQTTGTGTKLIAIKLS